MDDDDDSDRVIPWTALASSQSKTEVRFSEIAIFLENLNFTDMIAQI